MAGLDQGPFHQILHLLHFRNRIAEIPLQFCDDKIGDGPGKRAIRAALGTGGAEDGFGDLVHVEGHQPRISFLDACQHMTTR